MMTANDFEIIAGVLRSLPDEVREVAAPRFEQSLIAHYPDVFNLAKWRRAIATARSSNALMGRDGS